MHVGQVLSQQQAGRGCGNHAGLACLRLSWPGTQDRPSVMGCTPHILARSRDAGGKVKMHPG